MKRFFLGVFMLHFLGCEQVMEPPANLVPKEEMISAIIYMRMAEAKVLEQNIYGDSAKMVVASYEHEMYRKFDLDSASYVHSYNFYISQGEDWNYILNAVVDSLSENETRLKQLIE